MRITVEEAKCCGAGQCVMIAPEIFDQRDDGIATLLDAEPPQQRHAAVHKAAHACPMGAIRVSEDS